VKSGTNKERPSKWRQGSQSLDISFLNLTISIFPAFSSAERTLISSTVDLRESDAEPVKAGKYTLPFSMHLSSSLPTSMKASEHSSSCKIKVCTSSLYSGEGPSNY
jgi:hypothetical protein